MIKAIIFDCFGVLTTDTWKEFAATLPETQRQEARELNHAYGSALLSATEFRGAIKKLTGKLPRNLDGIKRYETNKNTEILKLIAILKQSYKIGLLSNVASNWIRDIFLTASEQDLFDDFIFSYEVRMTKPDPRIFALAAQRLNVPVEACILVDDVEYYGEVARQLGMKSVLYHDFQQAKTDLQKLLV